MADKVCTHRLEHLVHVILQYRVFMLTLCVLNITNSFVASLGNLLVVRALWKSCSMPSNLKKFFLSLALSDLAVGLFAQLMYGVIIAVLLTITANENYELDHLCPTVITISFYSAHLLASASFLNITAIAVDRLLAVSLHLRYRELVTSKRVIATLVSIWLTSAITTSTYISLPKLNSVITVVIELAGLLLTAVAYIRIYQVARYHHNQIESQLQLQYNQAMDRLREKKSTINAFFVYVVFIICYLPNLCASMLLSVDSDRASFLVAYHVTAVLVLLNSSINPLVYCWRYREIREIVKSTLKKIFHITEAGE